MEICLKMVLKWHFLGSLGNFREKNAGNGEKCHKDWENGGKWPVSNENGRSFLAEYGTFETKSRLSTRGGQSLGRASAGRARGKAKEAGKSSAKVSGELAGTVRRELELELIQSHMAQKPVLRGEVGCACVAHEVSVERGGMGERGCARRLGEWVWG